METPPTAGTTIEGRPAMRPAIWNEQTKLLATLMNTSAASFLALWVVAPAAAFLYTGG
jgi:hypothetical protein